MTEPVGPRFDPHDGWDEATPAEGPEPDDVWQEDDSAPTTGAGRVALAGEELAELMRASLWGTALLAAAILIGEWSTGADHALSAGFVLGGTFATINLRLLAQGYLALLDEQRVLRRLALGFLGSVTLMAAVALYIVLYRREWTVGFGLGLGIPALGGLIFALRRRGRR